MTPDQHLWACALEVERQHGDDAAIHAGFEIDRLTAEGDLEGAKVWQAILKRIEALARTSREQLL